MGLEFKDGLVCGSENGHGMTVGSMHPLDGVQRGQDGAREGGLALAYLDAEASEDDKALLSVSREIGHQGRLPRLTSASGVVSTTRPPAFLWRFFLPGLKDECCLMSTPLGSGRGVVGLFWSASDLQNNTIHIHHNIP
jgi:hypothetical protein